LTLRVGGECSLPTHVTSKPEPASPSLTSPITLLQLIRPQEQQASFLPLAKKELLEHLRRTRAMRRSRHHTQKTDDHGRIREAVSISERPATVEDRAVPGHWEGDLLCGSGGSQIATLVERQTRYVMLVKIASKDSETVVNALIRHAGKLRQDSHDRRVQ
jgi:IS30 family transposase